MLLSASLEPLLLKADGNIVSAALRRVRQKNACA
jgi:hypothetical protein